MVKEERVEGPDFAGPGERGRPGEQARTEERRRPEEREPTEERRRPEERELTEKRRRPEERERAKGKSRAPSEKTEGADDERKRRIIGAAVAEFAKHGYRNANTNRIVKAAGVSKGLLFHYFGSKKDLYVFLYNYAMRLITDEFFTRMDWTERDIFKRWRAGMVMKLELMRKHGNLFELVLDAYVRTDDEVRDEIDLSTMAWVETSRANLTERIDFSLFRPGIDREKAADVIFWTIDGYSRKWFKPDEKLSYYRERYDSLVRGLDEYLDMLRRLFYKDGEGDGNANPADDRAGAD